MLEERYNPTNIRATRFHLSESRRPRKFFLRATTVSPMNYAGVSINTSPLVIYRCISSSAVNRNDAEPRAQPSPLGRTVFRAPRRGFHGRGRARPRGGPLAPRRGAPQAARAEWRGRAAYKGNEIMN